MTFVIIMALILSLQIQKQHVLTHPPEVGCAPLPLSPFSSSLPRAAPPLPHTAVPRPAPGLSACLHCIWASAFTNPLPSRSGSPFPPTVKLPGLHIWRVEKLKPVPVAPENYGIFFSGDSYLVLHNGPEELSHLHLWIGQQSSRDEQGGCAILAVHLNTLLGERPVQHRESQGNESDLFMSYFPTASSTRSEPTAHALSCGFSLSSFPLVVTLQKAQGHSGLEPPPTRFLLACFPSCPVGGGMGCWWEGTGGAHSGWPSGLQEGGVESAFHKTSPGTAPAAIKKLYQVKGKKNIRATERVLSWDSFNTGDCFILDLGQNIFAWCGAKSNILERNKARDLALAIRDSERQGKAHVEIVTDGEEPADMIQVLGPKPSLKEGNPEEDLTADRTNAQAAALYKVSDATGQMNLTKLADSSPFALELLIPDDCFVLDNGLCGKIYIWKGGDSAPGPRECHLQAILQGLEVRVGISLPLPPTHLLLL
uniref:Capping actin protein, gelsolin like n=1 Tax=Bos mutus grunniens TaxID=30521 RepID=A0A8B9WNR9_BOSMU